MSMQAGIYKGKLIEATLCAIGANNSPALKMVFQPTMVKRGSIFVEGTFKIVDKLYFLSTDLAKSGKNAGQSRIEILRKELTDTYGHKGGLTQESLNELIGETEYELVVELSEKGYPQVKWVNKPGGKKFAPKPLPADFLSKIQAAFLGQPSNIVVAADPSDFFKGLKSDG